MKKTAFYTFLFLMSTLTWFSCKNESNTSSIISDIRNPLPTGEVLYFIGNLTGSYQVYRYETNQLTQITHDEDHNFWGVQVSKDQRKFLCYRSPRNSNRETNDYLNGELWMFDINGSNGRRLFSAAEKQWTQHGFASWIMNDSLLLMAADSYNSIAGKETWQLYITNLDGTNPKPIATNQLLCRNPVLMNDKKTILFTGLPLGDSQGKDKDIEVFTAELKMANGNYSLANPVQHTTNEFIESDLSCNQIDDGFYSFSILATDPSEYYTSQIVRARNTLDYYLRYVVDEGSSCRNNFWSKGQRFYFSNKLDFFSNFRIEKSNAEGGEREIVLQIPNSNLLHITGFTK